MLLRCNLGETYPAIKVCPLECIYHDRFYDFRGLRINARPVWREYRSGCSALTHSLASSVPEFISHVSYYIKLVKELTSTMADFQTLSQDCGMAEAVTTVSTTELHKRSSWSSPSEKKVFFRALPRCTSDVVGGESLRLYLQPMHHGTHGPKLGHHMSSTVLGALSDPHLLTR